MIHFPNRLSPQQAEEYLQALELIGKFTQGDETVEDCEEKIRKCFSKSEREARIPIALITIQHWTFVEEASSLLKQIQRIKNLAHPRIVPEASHSAEVSLSSPPAKRQKAIPPFLDSGLQELLSSHFIYDTTKEEQPYYKKVQEALTGACGTYRSIRQKEGVASELIEEEIATFNESAKQALLSAQKEMLDTYKQFQTIAPRLESLFGRAENINSDFMKRIVLLLPYLPIYLSLVEKDSSSKMHYLGCGISPSDPKMPIVSLLNSTPDPDLDQAFATRIKAVGKFPDSEDMEKIRKLFYPQQSSTEIPDISSPWKPLFNEIQEICKKAKERCSALLTNTCWREKLVNTMGFIATQKVLPTLSEQALNTLNTGKLQPTFISEELYEAAFIHSFGTIVNRRFEGLTSLYTHLAQSGTPEEDISRVLSGALRCSIHRYRFESDEHDPSYFPINPFFVLTLLPCEELSKFAKKELDGEMWDKFTRYVYLGGKSVDQFFKNLT